MQGDSTLAAAVAWSRPRVFILSDVRLYREGLALLLSGNESVELVGAGPSSTALGALVENRAEVVLLDAALLICQGWVRRVCANDGMKVVVFALSEMDQDVIACAEAGIAAYVERDGTAEELVDAVCRAVRGEFLCSARVAGLLFRRVSVLSAERARTADGSVLTRREREIVPLIERCMSNKEIARHLDVGTATVKNHIHNMLNKLQVRRRNEIPARARSSTERS
ncbi:MULTISPECIES: response regulator transcription factor [unclassified Burkholderia]|uniref:LuxR C-terminal-related transcriptional regulator n=1 Tax=unclassified Burkholderia TaxID=2613784 RepID=UPI0014206295|nr:MULTISPECIES: response regulator transcription factor [unclassified Burkholderia]NIE58657.1 response regulator transcription factor [Burkholderia sp. Ap-955]NIF10142.1 response regulator transcription factor [Burkholderia sp. Ax-1735]NIG03593.1 response regulator transcription factor [Burkholderia sp. Tr-849]